MFAVIPIFVFQHEIARIEGGLENLFSNVILTIVLTGLWVGFYEETAKFWIVKHTGKNFFRSIDDAIIFSIVVALGFAFIENVLYFHSIWNNFAIDESMRWFYVTFRSLGSMLLHIIASGILGYYYGIATFAKPVLQDKLSEGENFIFTKWIHRILHLKSETVFREEKIFEGLIVAASTHAVFNFLMGMSQHFTDTDSPDIARIFLLMAVPFLVGGFFWLTYLLGKKEDPGTLILNDRGRKLGKHWATWLINKYLKKCKIKKKVTTHTFRHTFATHLLKNKASIRVIQELLGHSSLATTQVYTKVDLAHLMTVHRRSHPRG